MQKITKAIVFCQVTPDYTVNLAEVRAVSRNVGDARGPQYTIHFVDGNFEQLPLATVLLSFRELMHD